MMHQQRAAPFVYLRMVAAQAGMESVRSLRAVLRDLPLRDFAEKTREPAKFLE
jgi:hypothetical protein